MSYRKHFRTILKCKMFVIISSLAILLSIRILTSEAEFKEFEQRLKFKPRLKYGWFHLKMDYIFQDLLKIKN